MLTFLGRGSAFTDEHNSAFFVENDELVLIDCAMSSFEKLNDMNMTLFKHIYVLVTHTHGDHSGAVAVPSRGQDPDLQQRIRGNIPGAGQGVQRV